MALIDVEAVDAQGQRCPTNEARVDFELQGPNLWRGGYNSGKTSSTNHKFLDTECGVNRVAIRSTLGAGAITLTTTRPGLASATVKIQSKPVKLISGWTRQMPQQPGVRARCRHRAIICNWRYAGLQFADRRAKGYDLPNFGQAFARFLSGDTPKSPIPAGKGPKPW